MFWLGLACLDRAGLLPPPQFTNDICSDIKLEYLRTHHFDSPAVLAVGSSVTLRSFDGDAVEQATGGKAMPFNGAFCGLKMNQTAFTARYFLARFPSVRDVLTIVTPQDLTECWFTEARLFNPVDVDDYVYRRRWAFPVYLAYFDPLTLVKNVMILRAMRDVALPLDTMDMDRYGDAPLDTTLSRPDLVYAALPPLDPVCFAALRGLAQEITEGGRRLVVVTTPLHPDWLKRYDPDGKIMQEISDRIRSALAGTTSTFWDAEHDFHVAREDFMDAIHIRWSGAKGFSEALVAATNLGQRSSAIDLGRSNPEIGLGQSNPTIE